MRTCKILTRTFFFYSHLHAIFGALYVRCLVNVYLSGTVYSLVRIWAGTEILMSYLGAQHNDLTIFLVHHRLQ